MANIAEGFERNRFAEFHQFLSVAKALCAEIRSHLYVAYDIGYLNDKRFGELLAQAEEVGRIVGGLRASLKDRSKPSIHSLSQHTALSIYEFHSLRFPALQKGLPDWGHLFSGFHSSASSECPATDPGLVPLSTVPARPRAT